MNIEVTILNPKLPYLLETSFSHTYSTLAHMYMCMLTHVHVHAHTCTHTYWMHNTDIVHYDQSQRQIIQSLHEVSCTWVFWILVMIRCSYQLSQCSSGIGAEDRWYIFIDTVQFSGWISRPPLCNSEYYSTHNTVTLGMKSYFTLKIICISELNHN